MTEDEILKEIKSRLAKELKDLIGKGNLVDTVSIFLGGFQNAISHNHSINKIDKRNHQWLLNFIEAKEDGKLSHSFNLQLSLQGLFLIYEKAYKLLLEDNTKSAEQIVSDIYDIIKNSELSEDLSKRMDDSNKLSLLNILANPKGPEPFTTEKDFEDKVLVDIKNLLNKDLNEKDLNLYDKEFAFAQYIVDRYRSIHKDVKVSRDSMLLCATNFGFSRISPSNRKIIESIHNPLFVVEYLMDLSSMFRTEPTIPKYVDIQKLCAKSVLNVDYKEGYDFNSLKLQKQTLEEAFKCLLENQDTDKFTEILTDPGNMFFDLQGNTVLHLAVQYGYIDIVKDLVRKGKNINAVDEYGQTPLHLAAQNGHKEIVNVLLEAKEINVNAVDEYGQTPLHLAAVNGRKEVVELLLVKGADINALNKNKETPLHLAAVNGRKEVVELLLKRRTNVNAGNKSEQTPLHLAAQNGHKEIVNVLLEAKEINVNKVDKYRQTPLHLAARNGHGKVVELLLVKGADINILNKNKETPLHLAAVNGRKEVVELLLKRGTNVNAGNKSEQTPLHLTAQNGHKEIVNVLLEAKEINVNAVDKYGQTPLHLAARNGHIEIVRVLIEKGVNPLLRDKNGKTPRDLAKNDDIKELLKEAEETQLRQNDDIKELLKEVEETQLRQRATINGIIAGCLTAVLCAAVAVTLFATPATLISTIAAVAIVTAVALAVGGITHSSLKPSTEVNRVKEEKTAGNGQEEVPHIP